MLDATYRRIAAKKADKKNSKGELKVLNEVDADDSEGLKGLMTSLNTKKKKGK